MSSEHRLACEHSHVNAEEELGRAPCWKYRVIVSTRPTDGLAACFQGGKGRKYQ